jgi:Xaa-Pro aminopeptidase
MPQINKSQLKAIKIATKVYSLIKIKAGMTERDVEKQIKSLLKKFRAKPSFRIIVGSGKRSALPHCFATDKVIKRGELVVIDFGAVYNGYCSDITRTVVVGKASVKQKKIYKIVKIAQSRAIKAIKAGKICSEVDYAARGYIQSKGFGKYFIHTTGHGIGKRVHQAPKISTKNRRRLKEGMVITIEPGIYIKSLGGVRIEDMFLVTKNGAKRLTR